MFQSIRSLLSLLSLASTCVCIPTLLESPPQDAAPLSPYLNSFSLEFKDFPLFAGNTTSPNQFSVNLLSNLAARTGVMPMIRIGGTTQDDAIFDANQTEPVITIGATNGTHRAPVTIGPSFFLSYGTFPSTKYIPGLNLATNGTAGIQTRQAEASSIFTGLGNSIEFFEIGNEPDLFTYWNRRPTSWNVSDYVAEWLNASEAVELALGELGRIEIGYFAPSFAGTDVGSGSNSMAPLAAFQHGLNVNSNIKQLSGHNYMGSATGAGVTLQSTLMNHASIVNSISSHVTLAKELQQYCSAPYIMGETNSLSGGGATGLSNVFGAALWVVDYALWQGTQNISRVHFHQSATSPYASWSPSTNPPTTNAPYYGNLMVAAAVGRGSHNEIAYLDLGNDDERTSAYAIYEKTRLKRVVVLNMIEWRSDFGTLRANETFSFAAPSQVRGARVERLTAAGAEVTDGITLGGLSFDYEPDEGKPVVANEAAGEERILNESELLSVVVQDTEAVILHIF